MHNNISVCVAVVVVFLLFFPTEALLILTTGSVKGKIIRHSRG